MSPRILPLVALIPALLLTACGGGGGSDPIPVPEVSYHVVQEFTSDAHLDGDVTSRGRARTAGVCGITGDLDTSTRSTGSMQYFSFDHASIPRDAEILSVQLELFQENVLGAPYVSHGVVVVDQVQLGPNLQGADYWLVPVASAVDVLSTNSNIGWKYADVTAALQRSLSAGWSKTAFRLRWSNGNTNGDGNFDFALFNDGEDACGSGNTARLIVNFR